MFLFSNLHLKPMYLQINFNILSKYVNPIHLQYRFLILEQLETLLFLTIKDKLFIAIYKLSCSSNFNKVAYLSAPSVTTFGFPFKR